MLLIWICYINFNNKKYVNDAFVRFKIGVVLEFEAVVHEQFQLRHISAMKVNSEEELK